MCRTSITWNAKEVQIWEKKIIVDINPMKSKIFDMKEEEQIKTADIFRKKSFFTETIFIALLTATSYLSAYAFQYEYLDYYSIPKFFIDISTATVLLVSLIELSIVISIFYILEYFLRKNKRLHWFFVLLTEIFCIPIMLFLWGVYGYKNLLFMVSVFLLSQCFVISFGYKAKDKIFKTDFNLTKETNKPSIIFLALKHFGPPRVLFVLALIFSIVVSLYGGVLTALYKTEYPVLSANPNWIVVSVYNSKLIAVEYSTMTNSLMGRVMILSMEKDELINQDLFLIKKIGRLKSSKYLFEE